MLVTMSDPVPGDGIATLALLLVALPDAQGSFTPLLGCEIGWPFLARSGKAELDGVAVQLVNPELGLSLGRPFRHDVIDGLGPFRRVDAVLGFEKDLAADGNGGFSILGDSSSLSESILGQRLPVRSAGYHGPLTLQLGFVFLDVVLRAGGAHQHGDSDHGN